LLDMILHPGALRAAWLSGGMFANVSPSIFASSPDVMSLSGHEAVSPDTKPIDARILLIRAVAWNVSAGRCSDRLEHGSLRNHAAVQVHFPIIDCSLESGGSTSQGGGAR
jgi:hypothetical protein